MGCLQLFNVLMNPLRMWYAVMCHNIHSSCYSQSHHLISNHHIWLNMIQQSCQLSTLMGHSFVPSTVNEVCMVRSDIIFISTYKRGGVSYELRELIWMHKR